jgi:hypothetical protein
LRPAKDSPSQNFFGRASFQAAAASVLYRRTTAPPQARSNAMQRLTFVRYTVKPDQIAENEALSRAVFRELRGTAPKDVTYALFKKEADFVHLFVNLRSDDSEAVTGLPSFKTYSKDVAARCAGPIEQIRLGLQLVDSYGLHPVAAPV